MYIVLLETTPTLTVILTPEWLCDQTPQFTFSTTQEHTTNSKSDAKVSSAAPWNIHLDFKNARFTNGHLRQRSSGAPKEEAASAFAILMTGKSLRGSWSWQDVIRQSAVVAEQQQLEDFANWMGQVLPVLK